MQVNALGAVCSGVSPVQLGLLAIPNALNLISLGPQAEALRAQRQEDEERQAHDPARQRQLAAAGLPTHDLTETIYQAERKMAPHSRAARQQLLQDSQQQRIQQRQAFQKSLADAQPRESGRAAATTSRTGRPAPASTQQPTSAARSGSSRSDGAPAPTTSETAKTNGTPAQRPVTAASSTNAATRSLPAVTSGAPNSPAKAVQATRLPNLTTVRTSPAATAKPAGAARGKAGGQPATAAGTEQTRSGRSARAAARAARTATAETGRSDANTARILRVLRSQISTGRSRATLRLDPPDLGTIRLQMDLRKEALSLRVDTQTTTAHRLLSEQVESLRQGLQAAGIQLEHIEIRPPAATNPAEDADLPRQPDGQPAGNDHSAHADAEHSPEQGTDSYLAEPPESADRLTTQGPATESLVNILA